MPLALYQLCQLNITLESYVQNTYCRILQIRSITRF